MGHCVCVAYVPVGSFAGLPLVACEMCTTRAIRMTPYALVLFLFEANGLLQPPTSSLPAATDSDADADADAELAATTAPTGEAIKQIKTNDTNKVSERHWKESICWGPIAKLSRAALENEAGVFECD